MAVSDVSVRERKVILDEHRALVNELRDIEARIADCIEKGADWEQLEKMRTAKMKFLEPLVQKYWNWIKPVRLSCCPICHQDYFHSFDPVDFQGFWWMERTQRPFKEPSSCAHFRLLSGAVDRRGKSFVQPLFEVFPGPEKPFVIPRILKMPGMAAVITKINMTCGFIAYPIVYFSEYPPKPGTLTQSWAQKEYRFITENSEEKWKIVEDMYDYDLKPWIKKNKLVVEENQDA